jgi:hypothetical protein
VRRSLVFAAITTCLVGCKRDERTVAGEHVLTEPTQLCRDGTQLQSCRPAEDVEALLERDDLEILAATTTSTGVQRARVLTLRSGGVVFRAKWRAHTTTTRRNSPRFELAAYAMQRLFLPPREYVVPPTAAHCFPLDAYRARVDRTARPTFAGSRCVYGILSYWLEDVTSLADAQRAGWFHGEHEHAFDPTLFERDRGYRDSITRLNMLTYVIGHRDSHARNFVIARSSLPVTHAVYSIDNSLSFTMSKNPRLQARHDWSIIRVPSLPRIAIDRLRAADDRLSSLAAIAVLRRDRGGLVTTSAGSSVATRGVDWTGDRLIVGMTPAEIEGIRARIAALLARVDRGELRLY